MSWLRRLFSGGADASLSVPAPLRPAPGACPLPPSFSGDESFDVAVVGESHYQDNLWAVCKPPTTSAKFEHVEAVLMLDDGNLYDDEAVAVLIEGRKVGHLSREDARKFRSCLEKFELAGERFAVRAVLTGGWLREGGERGAIGIELDLAFPRKPRRTS